MGKDQYPEHKFSRIKWVEFTISSTGGVFRIVNMSAMDQVELWWTQVINGHHYVLSKSITLCLFTNSVSHAIGGGGANNFFFKNHFEFLLFLVEKYNGNGIVVLEEHLVLHVGWFHWVEKLYILQTCKNVLQMNEIYVVI